MSMRKLLACLLLPLSIACAPVKSLPIASQVPPPLALDGEGPMGCDLRLYIEHNQGAEMKLSAVEIHDGPDKVSVSEGVCVKRHGKPLEMPERILIAGDPLCRFGYVCEGHPLPIKGHSRQTCVWNHVVRNAYPLSFTLVAENGKVSDYVALARVYRNGDLLSRYNAASALKDPRVLRFRGDELRVSSSPFAPRPPHLARMDLRLVPAGVAFDPAALDEEIVSYHGRTRERLTELGLAVVGTLDPQLGQNVSCALERLRSIQSQIKGFVTPTAKPPVTSCPTGDVQQAPQFTAFRARFDELTLATQGKLEQVSQSVDRDLARGREWLETALEKVRTDAKMPEVVRQKAEKLSELEQKLLGLAADKRAEVLQEIDKIKAEIERARAALARLDAAIDDASKLMADTESLAHELRNTVRRTLTDKAAQVRAYDAAIASLEKSGTLFEAYVDNPDVLAGEQRLAMQHGDSFQTFALAPWNGAVFRVTGEIGTEINADNLIPILDVIGFRSQWSDSRFSEFRAAVGALYFRDKRTTAGVEKEAFTPAFQLNVSLGTVKIGAALAPWYLQRGDATKAEKMLRILVGADLLKAISGTNVEVTQFTP
jgi:hypothetical protein